MLPPSPDSKPPQDTTHPYCIRRGKLVRPDFLQGIEEQWTRKNFKKNIVRPTYWSDSQSAQEFLLCRSSLIFLWQLYLFFYPNLGNSPWISSPRIVNGNPSFFIPINFMVVFFLMETLLSPSHNLLYCCCFSPAQVVVFFYPIVFFLLWKLSLDIQPKNNYWFLWTWTWQAQATAIAATWCWGRGWRLWTHRQETGISSIWGVASSPSIPASLSARHSVSTVCTDLGFAWWFLGFFPCPLRAPRTSLSHPFCSPRPPCGCRLVLWGTVGTSGTHHT